MAKWSPIKLEQQSTRRAISDGFITSKVRAALAADPITAEYQIGVETWDGIVELTAFVETAVAAGWADRGKFHEPRAERPPAPR